MPDQTQLVDELRRRIADPGACLPRRFDAGQPVETMAAWRARAVAAGLEDGTLGYVPATQQLHRADFDRLAAERDRWKNHSTTVQAECDRLAAELAEEKTDNARLERRCDRLTAQRTQLVLELGNMRGIAQGGWRHVAILTATLEAVENLTRSTDGDDLDPDVEIPIGEIRRALNEQIEGPAPVPGSSRRVPEPEPLVTLSTDCAHCGHTRNWHYYSDLRCTVRVGGMGQVCGCTFVPAAGESQASEPATTAAPKLAQGGIVRTNKLAIVGEQTDGCIVPQEADRG